MNKYTESMGKAVNWLINRQNDDGSLSPVDQGIGGYYKAPFALASRGRNLEALKLLNWVRENIQASDGDFRGPYPRQIHQNIYPYSNSWLIFAAHRLGQFDISNKGIEFLLKLQNPNIGGFFSKLNGDNNDEGHEGQNGNINIENSVYQREGRIKTKGEMNTMCTAMAGLACLQTGKLKKAILTAKFFKKIYDEQPELEKRFYFVYHTEKGLVTDFHPDDSRGYVIDANSKKQHYFNLGISTAFLTSLYMATEKEEYLNLAESYMDFINHCESDRFSTPQSGKLGWGSAYLALVTDKKQYKNMAIKIADYLVETQKKGGYWHNIGPEEDEFVTMDITAEFISLLNEIMKALV